MQQNSYRPIALTSKIMEKIIVRRLNYFSRKNNIIISSEWFRKKRSTMDTLILFENDVKKKKL